MCHRQFFCIVVALFCVVYPKLWNLNVFQVLNRLLAFLVLVAAEVQVNRLHHLPFQILYVFVCGLLLAVVLSKLKLSFVKSYV
jgi:hypothetical protein